MFSIYLGRGRYCQLLTVAGAQSRRVVVTAEKSQAMRVARGMAIEALRVVRSQGFDCWIVPA